MSHQTTHTVLMLRPACFGFNAQTAIDNSFQKEVRVAPGEIQQRASAEFDAMVTLLRQKEIEVIVLEDDPNLGLPDAVFLNNWLNTLPNGYLSVFPLRAASRRAEKRDDILQFINQQYRVTDFTDWSELEAEGFFLESTGSMVFDHNNRIIYACLSPRTHPAALERYARHIGYRAIPFEATDSRGKPIYHSNVLMNIGSGYAVAGRSSFSDELDWIAVSQLLRSTGHQVIPISREQVDAFAGNMLELSTKSNKRILVLSTTAMNSLTREQQHLLGAYCELVPVHIPTIEQVGGGGARCMLTELFLEPRH